MATSSSPSPAQGNLRPLSLAQRPLQLRSNSATDLQPQQPSSTSTSTNVTPNPPVQRNPKRYSTLSYATPTSPSATGSSASPLQSPMTTTLPGGLSRSSSRSGTRPPTNRASLDVSLFNGIAPKRPSSLYGSQPVTPGPASGTEETPSVSSFSDILSPDLASSRRGSTDTSRAEANAVVMTLAETHADLLQAIAQKEAKCLELRTALAQQEADLKELKSQWTSIVQKTIPASSHNAGSISMASAAVIREGMGRLFSNVTGPLASAFDALDPAAMHSPVEQSGAHAFAENPEAKSRRATMVRGHTPRSSSRSTASNSSFAASGHSISSSSSSAIERTDSFSNLHFDDARVTASSPLSRTGSDYFAENDRGSKSATPTPRGHGRTDSTRSDFALRDNVDFGDLTSPSGGPPSTWKAAIAGIDGLNKKWEEIQRGDTFVKSSRRASTLISDVSASFISTFAPPLNEPLKPQKPRLLSRPPSQSHSPVAAPTPPSVSAKPLPPATSATNSKSLLDDDDEDANAQPLMVPSKPTPQDPSSGGVTNIQKESPASNEDDEAWNW